MGYRDSLCNPFLLGQHRGSTRMKFDPCLEFERAETTFLENMRYRPVFSFFSDGERDLNPMLQIVDFKTLADILKANPNTLRKKWRHLPHSFIGLGRNLKGARFDVSKVIKALEDECIQGQAQARHLHVQVQVQGENILGTKVRDQKGRQNGRGKKAGRTDESTPSPSDPFNLFRFTRGKKT